MLFNFAFQIQDHIIFKLTSFCILVTNLVIIMLDKAPIEMSYNDKLELSNFVCIILYTLELGFKFTGYGVSEYFKATRFHYLECFIVV